MLSQTGIRAYTLTQSHNRVICNIKQTRQLDLKKYCTHCGVAEREITESE